jgi:peptide/nickel transport system substrate-binding protein
MIATLPMSLIPQVFAQGPATDTIVFKQVDKTLAAAAVKAGELDYYIFGLNPSQVEVIAGDPEYTLYRAPSGMNDIGLNPAPSIPGVFNPFSIKEVRFAMNYIVDRDFIVNQLYQGSAAPMFTFMSSYDPDFVTIYEIVAKYEFGYDLTTAASIVDPALTAAGCEKVEGKWHYQGSPVTIKFIIRVEDERREIGDTFASNLERLGFTVDRQYMQFGQAIPIVYGTDPGELQWHCYTEGWGKGALTKYDASTINQYGAPWFTWMPGFMEEGWWSYTNDSIDELGLRIYNGDFSGKEERDALYVECAEMIAQEACRIFCVTTLDIHPADADVRGLTEDLGTGLRSLFNAREAYVAGKDTLSVGSLWVWTETSVYNPVAGHDDVYSVDVWRNVMDPFMWNNPHSGLPQPFRIGYEVTTAGPDGKLDVPADAWTWDAANDEWVAVGEGVQATSKVVFDGSNYIGDKWHHGGTIDWADILYTKATFYEIAYDEVISSLESSTSAQLVPVLDQFVGYEIDRVADTVTVYLNYWHFDENYIADYANVMDPDEPTAHYPWEIQAGMDKVVFEDGLAAYSDSASDRLQVPWLSLVLKEHATLVNNAVQELEFSDFESRFNVLGEIYATEADLTSRKADCDAWFNEHEHMVVSDGSFYMDTFSAAGGTTTLKANRDEDYPLSSGTMAYGIATAPEIVRVGIPTVVPGGPANFVVELSGLPPMGVKYLIRDPLTAEIKDIGSAEAISASKFVVKLSSEFTENLDPGLYELSLAGYSDVVAQVSVAKEFFDVFNVNPLEESFRDVGTSVSTEISTVNTNLSENIATAVNSLSSTLTTLMYLIGAVAVLVVVNIIISLRK